MNQNKTSSILQRLPVVLAVTAASYGLGIGQAQAFPASKAGTSIQDKRPG